MDRVADGAKKTPGFIVRQGIRQALLLGLLDLFFPNKGQSYPRVFMYKNWIP